LRVPKKDHYINNVFHQSALQDRLEQKKRQKKAPNSHATFSKPDESIKTSAVRDLKLNASNNQEAQGSRANQPNTIKAAGRPIFGGTSSSSSISSNIDMGRARTFYSSNIF